MTACHSSCSTSDGTHLPDLDLDNTKVRDVLQAARALFLAGAYDAVSTDAIAKAAGISKATLYSHFVSKEMLFAVMIREECRSIRERLPEPDLAGADIGSALTRIARTHTAILTTTDALSFYRSVVAQTPRFPELGRIFFEAGPCTLLRRIAEALREAVAAGELSVPDIERAAAQFMALITGNVPMTVMLGFAPPTNEDWERQIESGVAMFLARYGN